MLISYGLNIYSGSRFYSFKWCTFQLVWWCIFQLVYTMDMRLGGSLWHFAVPIFHTLGISFCMATQSKDKVGKSQSPCACVEAFGTDMEACGVII